MLAALYVAVLWQLLKHVSRIQHVSICLLAIHNMLADICDKIRMEAVLWKLNQKSQWSCIDY